MYLASDPDGSGPWLYSMDVEHRIAHRLSTGLERYTSLAASADGRRLAVTLASPKSTLWRLRIGEAPAEVSAASRISLTTGTGFSLRLGPNYLLYVSETGTSESIWKLANGTATELWSGQGARVLGGPAISADGRSIAFSVQQRGQKLLYVMQTDGTNARIVADSLDLQGAPAWAPDGQLVVYSGPDVGTKFSVKAVSAGAESRPLPALTLTRGARHVTLLTGGRALVFLRGEIQHKNLWLIDLETGTERQLTNLTSDFDIRDFDISPDGRELVLERVQGSSEVALLDLPRP
jgi:Tol biopolymer transport system component